MRTHKQHKQNNELAFLHGLNLTWNVNMMLVSTLNYWSPCQFSFCKIWKDVHLVIFVRSVKHLYYLHDRLNPPPPPLLTLALPLLLPFLSPSFAPSLIHTHTHQNEISRALQTDHHLEKRAQRSDLLDMKKFFWFPSPLLFPKWHLSTLESSVKC